MRRNSAGSAAERIRRKRRPCRSSGEKSPMSRSRLRCLCKGTGLPCFSSAGTPSHSPCETSFSMAEPGNLAGNGSGCRMHNPDRGGCGNHALPGKFYLETPGGKAALPLFPCPLPFPGGIYPPANPRGSGCSACRSRSNGCDNSGRPLSGVENSRRNTITANPGSTLLDTAGAYYFLFADGIYIAGGVQSPPELLELPPVILVLLTMSFGTKPVSPSISTR